MTYFNYRSDRWWIDTISHMLAAASDAPLQEVTVSYALHTPPSLDSPEPSYRASLTELEQLLLAHPAAPSIRWRLGEPGEDFATLITLIRDGMPRLHAMGKVVFEPWDLHCADEWLLEA